MSDVKQEVGTHINCTKGRLTGKGATLKIQR